MQNKFYALVDAKNYKDPKTVKTYVVKGGLSRIEAEKNAYEYIARHQLLDATITDICKFKN